MIHQSVFISLTLLLYFSRIVWCNIVSPRLGEKPKPYSRSIYEILQFRLWVLLKVVLTLMKIFLMSHLPIVYKILQVNTFYSSYYFHHYDHCMINIVLLYYMKTWELYITKIIYCPFVYLFVCVIADSKYTYNNSKPISLFLEYFFLEKTVFGLCGSCSLLSHLA